jgi:hypothetical protein
MAIGFAKEVNQAFCRATLQPSFKYRDTELNRYAGKTRKLWIDEKQT